MKRFDFGEKNGLSIIMGDNGIGKSSLIRAFKFVLYDEFDNDLDFKIKNELNIIAWEEQNFDMYVVLDFTYDNDTYLLKRGKQVKAGISEPKSDADFISYVTLHKNGIITSNVETDRILKNIIPKKISEYILFEGETISKYKKLLDSNQNMEIYNSIRKILGLNLLENSLYDLKNQLSTYESEKVKIVTKNTANEKIRTQLAKYSEEKTNLLDQQKDARAKLEETKKEKNKNELILKNNERVRRLMEDKNSYESIIYQAKKDINTLKEGIKDKIREYKSFSKEHIEIELRNTPNKIIEIENNVNANKSKIEKIKQLEDMFDFEECQYCGNHMGPSEIRIIEQKIEKLRHLIIPVTENDMLELAKHNEKSSKLNDLIEDVPDLDKGFIKKEELKIQQKIVEIDGYDQLLKMTNNQIEVLGGVGDLEKVGKAYSQAVINIGYYERIIEECGLKLEETQKKIDKIYDKNIIEIDLSSMESKIKTTKKLIEVFRLSIDKFSEKMRMKVQEDATKMFKQISENKEYSRLAFDEHYGLKLLDNKNRVVPNISSGYMNLITISLIYGLHKNSSLTGTIVLDAPFSVLTEFHRENIISTFQKLSPQVILLVYKDQIDLMKIREDMKGNLLNEFEIFQDRTKADSSYKTEIRRVE